MKPIKWTEVGREYNAPETKRAEIVKAIEGLDWVDPEGQEFGMMPGHGIMAVIQDLRIPRVQRVAVSRELAPLGFYAIEALYRDGLGRIYVIDAGSEIIPVGSHMVDASRTPRDSLDLRHKAA